MLIILGDGEHGHPAPTLTFCRLLVTFEKVEIYLFIYFFIYLFIFFFLEARGWTDGVQKK